MINKKKEENNQEEIKIRKRVVFLAALTLFTALIWVALDSYRQLIKGEQLRKFDHLIQPINPELRTDILKKIEKKKEYRLDEIKEFFLPTPTISELEEIGSPSGLSTESGEPSE